MGTASRAVVTTAVTAFCVLGSSCSSPNTTDTTTPTTGTIASSTESVTTANSTPAVSSAVSPATLGSRVGDLEAGTYEVPWLPEPASVTLPAGWAIDDGNWLRRPGKASFVGFWTVSGVYLDGCVKTETAKVSTATDVVERLAAQTGTDATVTPMNPSAGGVAVTKIELSAAADLAACGGRARLWTDTSGAAWISEVGETWTVFVLDLKGKPGIISAGGGPHDAETAAQIDAIVASLTLT